MQHLCLIYKFLDTLSCHSYMFERRGNTKVAPKGCFTVYIGEDHERFVVRVNYLQRDYERFVVPVNYLQSAYFVELLKESGEVYRFDQKGPLKLPCSVDRFQKVLHLQSIQKEKENLLGQS
ncbi:hypothetical protein SUGI_1035750 [Cryptomeria japonica]|nr:hypothetical protein SUGI_1035750 [Cryptomeria japonica]